MLLNSSLNAAILIACSREIKRIIKPIFERCCALNFHKNSLTEKLKVVMKGFKDFTMGGHVKMRRNKEHQRKKQQC